MSRRHTPFAIELAGKIGPPVLSATVVLCLITGQPERIHFVLIGVGLGLIALEHWFTRHRGEARKSPMDDNAR